MKRKNEQYSAGITLLDILLYGVFFVLVIIGFVFLYYELREYDVARERDITKQSLEYQESQITQLQVLMDEWLDIQSDLLATDDVARQEAYQSQQSALIDRMQVIVNRVPDMAVPASILEFLNERKDK